MLETPEIPGIPFYALTLVRRRLRYMLIKDIKEGIHIGTIMLDLRRTYPMYWQQAAIVTIFRNECDRIGYEISHTESLVELLMEDFKRLTVVPAVYAWTAIEETDQLDCLDQHGLDVDLAQRQMQRLPNPETIQYGAILKHYTPIYRVAQYLAGFSKDEENALFTKEEISIIRKNTRRNLELNFKPKDLEKFGRDISKVEEDFDPIAALKYSL